MYIFELKVVSVGGVVFPSTWEITTKVLGKLWILFGFKGWRIWKDLLLFKELFMERSEIMSLMLTFWIVVIWIVSHSQLQICLPFNSSLCKLKINFQNCLPLEDNIREI